ncbi:MAG TPA: SH3 domain-containing protein [Polyangiaceae bacterium]|nr:SH3 domain-containing protein [Polyangiaceae bacterium]
MRYALPVLLSVLAMPVAARAADEEDAYARVVVAEAELRAGPGVSHRVIYRAPRGETFLISSRETAGFWLQVTLPDGRIGYVLGDTVEPVSATEDSSEGARKPGILAPPALQDAHGGFAMMAGLYGFRERIGYVELRPAWVISPAIALEPYVGVALQSDSRRLIYGGAGTLNLLPDKAITPFVNIGFGGMYEQPKDEFVRPSRKWFHARAGGGLLFSFRLRVSVRLEADNLVLFEEDDYQNVQTITAGLGTYF